jgi:ABC-type uncharacterized transport system ATPase subunit
MVGTTIRRRYGGLARTVAATPLSRAEASAMRERARSVLAVAGLEDRADTPTGLLSGAEQRLLMVLTAFASEPRLLLVDEPSTGLSAQDAERMAGVLQTIRARGVTLVLVEHNLHLVGTLADRVTVLDAGKVIAEGTPAEVAEDPLVQDAYLGPGGADLLGPVGGITYIVRFDPRAGWQVQREGASRASSRHATKAAAVARGKELAARKGPARLIVHRKDGSVERTLSFDPAG